MYFGDDSSNLPFLSIPDRLDLKKERHLRKTISERFPVALVILWFSVLRLSPRSAAVGLILPFHVLQ
jgi:hypothetical protein